MSIVVAPAPSEVVSALPRLQPDKPVRYEPAAPVLSEETGQVSLTDVFPGARRALMRLALTGVIITGVCQRRRNPALSGWSRI